MKLRIGDIFTIPVTEEGTGFGQIVNIPNRNNFIICVFEKIYSGREWPSMSEIANDKILLLGYTMDAKIYRNDWKIIGNETSTLPNINLPFFKLGTPPDYNLVDFKGMFLRKINKELFNKLDYLTVVAPIRYENALKAYHQLTEWRKDFDNLLYSNIPKSVEEL